MRVFGKYYLQLRCQQKYTSNNNHLFIHLKEHEKTLPHFSFLKFAFLSVSTIFFIHLLFYIKITPIFHLRIYKKIKKKIKNKNFSLKNPNLPVETMPISLLKL